MDITRRGTTPPEKTAEARDPLWIPGLYRFTLFDMSLFAERRVLDNARNDIRMETVTTSEPPLTTSRYFSCARSDMNCIADGGMFLSMSP